MEEGDSGCGLYRPDVGAESRSSDATLRNLEAEKRGSIDELDNSKLVGVPVEVVGDSAVGGGEESTTVVLEVKTGVELAGSGGVKRKRGRPPRGQVKQRSKKRKKEKVEEEEEVCFLCFDGGSLVLCDRKGCPKAYHPACIKRDEAFLRSKAKWNCGWHICSVCQKAAHYMCYLCTYSLCKRCTKDAEYVCVRGNKGFCTTCMRMVMMIENGEQENKEMAQVDFDDESSWEYLFKVYWIYLKGKLSLTLGELAQAKNPWESAKGKPWNVHYCANDCKGLFSDSYSGPLELNNLNRKNTKKQLELLNKDVLCTGKLNNDKPQLLNDFPSAEKLISEKATSLNGCTEWASKELLEFVAHEKNGDTSVLSQFDVQALLLDYIKRNNLCDPHLKSEILCDSRLRNLFGKPHMGHFDMLKLLESHFFKKEGCQKDIIEDFFVDTIPSQVAVDIISGGLCSSSSVWTTHGANCKGLAISSLGANNSEGLAVSFSQYQDSFKSNSSCSEQFHVHSLRPSSTLSESSNVTLAHQESHHDGERWNPGLNHGNLISQRTAGCQINAEQNKNQSDTQGHSGPSSEHNGKSLQMNFCRIGSDSNYGFASLTKSTGSSERNGEMDALNLPSSTRTSSNDWDGEAGVKQESVSSNVLNPSSPTTKPSIKDQKVEAAGTQSLLSNSPVQDSGPSWCSISYPVIGGMRLGERVDECGGHSPAPKPSIEDWDSGLISVSSLKSAEVMSDHVATPTSRHDQLAHSSLSQPAPNVCTQSAMIIQPIEFCTLAEESVSDLLAEVDALEFQSGLASPTSKMRCSEELFQDSRNECFSSIEELSPPEPGKSDAFSSTGDTQLPSQSSVVDPVNISSSQSLSGAEVEEETKSTDVLEKEIQPSVPSNMGNDFINTKITLGGGFEAMDTSWGRVQGNGNLNWGGSTQGITNMGWGFGQVSGWGNVNRNLHTVAGNSVWESQQTYGGVRLGGRGDGAFHSANSEFSRCSSSWSGQSYGGGGGSGWYSVPPKAQRVCKFYESGHCKKGAMCKYLHR